MCRPNLSDDPTKKKKEKWTMKPFRGGESDALVVPIFTPRAVKENALLHIPIERAYMARYDGAWYTRTPVTNFLGRGGRT